jgi:hypothetical protein
MAKQVLKSLDLTSLAVALDRAEEAGLNATAPAPDQDPGNAVYLKYPGPGVVELVAGRLAHVTIQLRTPAGAGKNKKILPVFHKPAIDHVLGFLMTAEEVAGCMRGLDRVNHKYWKVL